MVFPDAPPLFVVWAPESPCMSGPASQASSDESGNDLTEELNVLFEGTCWVSHQLLRTSTALCVCVLLKAVILHTV